MKESENLLIDCLYIDQSWSLSSSLAIYGGRLIHGFMLYGHYHVSVLVWRGMESSIDKLVGCEVNKIILDHNEIKTMWRPYYKLSNILPKKLKREIRSRNISIIINPFHYGVLFFYPHPIKQYGVVHDLFYNEFEKDRKSKIAFYFWQKYQRLLLSKFANLITISKCTHDELLLKDGFDSEIVYNSITFDSTIVEQPVESVLGKRYILDVNRFPESKNAEVLICALGLLKEIVPHFLYLKGDHGCEGHRKSLEKLVVKLGLENRVIFDTKYRQDGEMRYLYSHADLFVSPSLQEGFGYTPIEAAIIKTPVLVSNIDVFKDVTCGKIPTFDPHSPEDLANHIKEILSNPPNEQERTCLANIFLERYSLNKQIVRFEEILRSL